MRPQSVPRLPNTLIGGAETLEVEPVTPEWRGGSLHNPVLRRSQNRVRPSCAERKRPVAGPFLSHFTGRAAVLLKGRARCSRPLRTGRRTPSKACSEMIIAAGSVSTHAKAMLRTVASCSPEPFAAMVPAMPEDRTCVVETGNPRTSAAPMVAAARISARGALRVGQVRSCRSSRRR